MITEDEYPQMTSSDAHRTPPMRLPGPAAYKRGEDVPFLRPVRTTSWTWDGRTLMMTMDAEVSIHRTVYTHETSMHQFKSTEGHGSMLVRLTLWTEDVFRVEFTSDASFSGERGSLPSEARMLIGSPEPVDARLAESQDALILSTAKMTVRISRDRPCIRAMDASGVPVFSQKRAELFTSDVFDISVASGACAFDSFELLPGEQIYGLGERFDHVARRGVGVDFWNKDAIGTSSPRTYINVPFVLSTRGWGLFVNSSRRMEWEIGTLDASTLGVAVEDGGMDYFAMLSGDPAAVLRRYCALTGAPGLPPIWSFGLWMSRNSYVDWNVVERVADALRERGIPADVLHLDTAWFKQDWNCDLRFSEERFPQPEAHLRTLRERGFRTCLWQYNFVPPRADNHNYIEGVEKGYFVVGPDGAPYPCAGGVEGSWTDDLVIDFTNPDACAWYAAQIEALIHMGASAVKADFGEGVPEEGIYRNMDGRDMHNLYSLVYNATLYQAVRRADPDALLWARSGTAGSQRYPVHWGGDSQCSWAGLAGTLRGALSLGLSGFPFYSHDVGGFIGRPDPELYIRWAQFGLFSSHTRCHGAGNENSREPWSFGADAERIFKRFAILRYALLPYIYAEARKCIESCKPMVRALVIEHPRDRNVYAIDDQYYFGDWLMVAPVLLPLADSPSRDVYLPGGVWYDYWTKRAIVSRGEWRTVPLVLDEMPIFVRRGALLAYAAPREHTGNRAGDVIRLEGYGLQDGEYRLDAGDRDMYVRVRGGLLRVDGMDCESYGAPDED